MCELSSTILLDFNKKAKIVLMMICATVVYSLFCGNFQSICIRKSFLHAIMQFYLCVYICIYKNTYIYIMCMYSVFVVLCFSTPMH